jgi:hypothetical protein
MIQIQNADSLGFLPFLYCCSSETYNLQTWIIGIFFFFFFFLKGDNWNSELQMKSMQYIISFIKGNK